MQLNEIKRHHTPVGADQAVLDQEAHTRALLNYASKHLETERPNVNPGDAPNGKQYNDILMWKSKDPQLLKQALEHFKKNHWGAKTIVDVIQRPDTVVVYLVDNHKYGYWKASEDGSIEKQEEWKGSLQFTDANLKSGEKYRNKFNK